MQPFDERSQHFDTQIKFPGIQIKLEEVEVNILTFDERVTSINLSDYYWEHSLSISTDAYTEEPYDELVCYITEKLIPHKGKYDILMINTLHVYHISQLNYKKAHEELYKSIARESIAHANELLHRAGKETCYETINLPFPDEDFLDDDATEWNKRGYIPQASKPVENTYGKRPNQKELDALNKRSKELVDWIDAHDESDGIKRTEEEEIEYWRKYGEWAKLSKQLWHFKLIARNLIAYIITKIITGMEKKLKETPDNYDLREMYDLIKEDYNEFMEIHKDEFAKN